MQITDLHAKYLSSTGVATDTRSIEKGNLFFALKGDKFNANQFAAEAFAQGAAFVVVDEIADPAWVEKFGDKLILVSDVLKTLQQLSGYHRSQFKCPVLAITGSNGKTTTKELVAAVLSKKHKTYATKGNLNNHIGIPLTLLSIKSDVEFAIIEMGANHIGEIASYCEYANPDFGLITNVGLAHTEGFGGFEGVIKGKTELYAHLISRHGKIFVNADNSILTNKISELNKTVADSKKVITYGNNQYAFCQGKITTGKEFLSLVVFDGEKEVKIETHLVGEYNFENVLSAVCIGKYFGVEMEMIKEAIEEYVPSNNRSQKFLFGSNTVILDAYNANPSSMFAALRNFETLKSNNKIVILGEMMELGALSKTEHEKIAATAGNMILSKKIFVGKGFEFLKNDSSVIYFETTGDLKTWFQQQQFENCYMLVKGSRKNELEKIFKD